MQITTFSDYCLRILIYLAVSDEDRASSRQIAEQYDISVHHIAKAAKWLTREGYLSATKGKGGGLTLAKPANEISIGAVIRKAEAGSGLVECMRTGGKCAIGGACGLSAILDDAREAFYEILDRRTLSDAVVKRQGIARLLRLSESLPT